MTYLCKNGERGYIALMATIVIAAILLVMSVEGSLAGWHARFNVLGTEAKEQASALAQGCADQALSAIVTDPSFTGDATTTTSVGTCHVFLVAYNVPIVGVVTIKTQANVRGSYANLEMQMNMSDIHIDSVPSAPTKGTLVIITNVVNNGSGIKTPPDFTMNVTAGNPSQTSFPGNESGVPVTVDPGTYSVTGVTDIGYARTVSTNCSGTIAPGAIKFCTITYDDITTTLTVLANVTNDNGGTLSVNDFPLFINGTPATPGVPYTVSTGAHSVSATPMSGYTASAWGYQCSGGGSVSVLSGENKTCIINFNDNPPPAPSCADTVTILDRTGSMSNTDLANEKIAANSLTDLYAGVLPPALPPHLGFGSIGGLNGSAASIPLQGQLSTAYPTLKNAITTITGSNSSVGSDLSAGIATGTVELGSARHTLGNEKVLILVSDGDPNQPSGSINQTLTLSPNVEPSVGTSTTWSTNTGSKVNAVAADDGDSSYLVPPGLSETYLLANASIPSDAINISVTLHAIAKRGSGSSASIVLMAENGASTTVDGGHTLTANYVDYTWTMNTNPLTGVWTPGEVNGWTTKFGFQNTSGSSGSPRVTQLFALVNYTTLSNTSTVKVPTAANTPNTWSNPTRAFASDNSYATDAVSGHQQGYGVFGLSIPSGGTVTGISVVTEAKISGTPTAVTTPTLLPNGQGSQTQWTNGEATVDESGTPDCSTADSISTNTTNNRESMLVDTTSIPDGATITSVDVISYDKADTSAGGTYRTFVRINGVNTDAGTNLSAGTTGGNATCNSAKTQTIGSLTSVKVSTTTLEVGVVKVAGNTNTVRVGAIRAVITYTPPMAGTLGVALSSNGGSSWTSVTRDVNVGTSEAIGTPVGNSAIDMWGRTWIPADFNNGSFLLRVQNNAYTGTTLSLDQVTVSVSYTLSVFSTTTALSPVGVGTYDSWTPNSSSTISAVQSNDNDTSFVSGEQGAQTFTFTNGSVPAGATNIQVSLHAVVKEVGGANGNIKLLAERSSQASDGGHTLSGSYSDYSWTMANNPLGGAWTRSEVNNWTMRFGVLDNSTGGTIPRVTRMYLVVTYTITTDPIQASLDAADAAKLAGVDVFTIHFGSDTGPYAGKKLLANLASGNTIVTGHQNGSFADPGGVVASDTGYIAPSLAAGTSQWTNPTRALVSDNSYATDTVNGHVQGYTKFGFNLPPTATVNGIAIEVEAKSSDPSGCQVGAELSTDNGATYTATNLVGTVTGTDVLYILGSASNLWGRSWSIGDVTDGKFVVRLKDVDPGNACTNGSILSVDRIRARVYFTVNTENGDGDNFFVSPTSADMQGIFNFIGTQVCPAIGFSGASAPPTTGEIAVVTRVINNNGGALTASGVAESVTGGGASPNAFSGSGSGIAVTLNPGSYSISGTVPDGYEEIQGAECSSSNAGSITAGENRVCVLTYDDIPPPPPAPDLTIHLGSWKELPIAN